MRSRARRGERKTLLSLVVTSDEEWGYILEIAVREHALILR